MTPTVDKQNDGIPGQSFEAFFKQRHKLVYRVAYSVTHNPDDARDVVQNVFLNLLQRRDLSEVDRNAEGFLYRAAMNEALHVLRSRRRQAQVIAGDLDSVEDAS